MDDGFDFSPLSDAEREAAAHELEPDGSPDEAKPICAPADAESPQAAAVRLFGRAPNGLWRYADAAGALAFCVCRWNKPDADKEIRPLSWFDGEGWRFAHWPDPRPLYNLEKLAAQPDAPVVVTEGEKAADAAARIFPRSIVTTSSGGPTPSPRRIGSRSPAGPRSSGPTTMNPAKPTPATSPRSSPSWIAKSLLSTLRRWQHKSTRRTFSASMRRTPWTKCRMSRRCASSR
jgi:hypothetical protein